MCHDATDSKHNKTTCLQVAVTDARALSFGDGEIVRQETSRRATSHSDPPRKEAFCSHTTRTLTRKTDTLGCAMYTVQPRNSQSQEHLTFSLSLFHFFTFSLFHLLSPSFTFFQLFSPFFSFFTFFHPFSMFLFFSVFVTFFHLFSTLLHFFQLFHFFTLFSPFFSPFFTFFFLNFFHFFSPFSPFFPFFTFLCERKSNKRKDETIHTTTWTTHHQTPQRSTTQHSTSWRSATDATLPGHREHTGGSRQDTHGTPVLTTVRRPWVAQPHEHAHATQVTDTSCEYGWRPNSLVAE